MNNNRGLLATGIILLCVGIVLFFVGYNVVSEITAYDVEGIPISEWLMRLSPSLRQQYETGQSYMQYGSILVIMGLISWVLFIMVSRKKPIKITKDSPQRSLLKAISWRVIATATTMVIIYLVTGNLDWAFVGGAVDVVI